MMANWQPIETAPTNGKHLLLYCGTYWPPGETEPIADVEVGSFRASHDLAGNARRPSWRPRLDGPIDNRRLNPSHWADIPEPPAALDELRKPVDEVRE